MGDIMYTVINIEDGIVLLENRVSREIISVNTDNLDNNIKENDIVDYVNGIYVKNIIDTENIKSNIRARFNRLKK